MAWSNPVFDRTQEDVDTAIAQIEAWKAAQIDGLSVVVTELKGCRNLSDLNRIENNILFLENKLSSLHYPPSTQSKTWGIEGLPSLADIQRILNNVQLIIDAYFQFDDAPMIPEAMLNYTEINAVEENLYLIKMLLDGMESYFRKSGTFKCGSDRLLPMWRG